MSHAATGFTTLRKVEEWSSFPATYNVGLPVGMRDVSRTILSPTLRCKLLKKIASFNMAFKGRTHFLHRKLKTWHRNLPG